MMKKLLMVKYSSRTRSNMISWSRRLASNSLAERLIPRLLKERKAINKRADCNALQLRKTYSKAVKGKKGDQQESRLQRPATKEEEDADLQRALELSTQEVEETLVEDTSSNQFQW